MLSINSVARLAELILGLTNTTVSCGLRAYWFSVDVTS
jgi:hypothetical protein